MEDKLVVTQTIVREVLWIGRPVSLAYNSAPKRKTKISTVVDKWMPEHESVIQDFNSTHVWHKVPTCTRDIPVERKYEN